MIVKVKSKSEIDRDRAARRRDRAAKFARKLLTRSANRWLNANPNRENRIILMADIAVKDGRCLSEYPSAPSGNRDGSILSHMEFIELANRVFLLRGWVFANPDRQRDLGVFTLKYDGPLKNEP